MGYTRSKCVYTQSPTQVHSCIHLDITLLRVCAWWRGTNRVESLPPLLPARVNKQLAAFVVETRLLISSTLSSKGCVCSSRLCTRVNYRDYDNRNYQLIFRVIIRSDADQSSIAVSSLCGQ